MLRGYSGSLPLIAGAALVLATGIVHGVWTDRWGNSAEVTAAAERLEKLPLVVSDWRGRIVDPDPGEVALSDCAACAIREYTNAAGDNVTVVLLCGRPGAISIHTPDACYKAAGYEAQSEPSRWRPTTTDGAIEWEFMKSKFREGKPRTASLEILWSWGAAGKWSAPANPRVAFASKRALYKIYVLRQLPQEQGPIQGDATLDFVTKFMPELDRALFSR